MQLSRITHIVTVTLALSLVLFLAASIEIHTLAQMSLTVCHCGQQGSPERHTASPHLCDIRLEILASKRRYNRVSFCIFINRGDSAQDVGLSFHHQTDILRRRLSKDTATNKIREIEF
jgi:hypothetical protein